MIVEPGTICETSFGAPAYVVEVLPDGTALGIRRKGQSTRFQRFEAPASSLREAGTFSRLWIQLALDVILQRHIQRMAEEREPSR